MNDIFYVVDENIFNLISNCEVNELVRDNLQTAHECTDMVCMSRIQMLNIKFVNSKMKEDEFIDEFNGGLDDC